MDAANERSQNERWRLLCRMGDDLLSLPVIHDQIQFIQSHFSLLIGPGTQVTIRLSELYKPLPHSCEDALEEDEFVASSGLSDQFNKTGSQGGLEFTVPMQTPDEKVGVLQMWIPTGIQTDADFDRFVESAGGYFAKIFELSRLYRIKNWRMEQIALMRSVNREIVQLQDAESLYTKVTHLIQSTFQCYFVAIYTADLAARKIVFQSSAGKILNQDQLRDLSRMEGIAFGDGLLGACAQNAHEIYLPDVAADTRFREVKGLESARCELCLPLMVGDQLLGILEILGEDPDSLHPNDILVLRVLSDNIAVAMRNSDLINNLLAQTWVSTLLLQVSEMSLQHDCVDDLAAAIVRIIPLFSEIECCAIYLHEKIAGEYILNTHFGFEKDEAAALAMLPYTAGGLALFEKLREEKEILPFNRTLLNLVEPHKRQKERTCGLVPLAAHGTVYGAILVDSIGSKPAFQAAGSITSSALAAVGRQTALAIENLRFKEAQENEAYVTAVLLQVSEIVATASDLQETLGSILNLLPLVVGVDTAFVYLLDEGMDRLHLSTKQSYLWKNQISRLPSSIRYHPKTNSGFLLDAVAPSFFEAGSTPIEDWLKMDINNCLDESARALVADPLLMVMPLFTHEARYGLLFVLESEKGYEFREKKIEIVAGIARNLSMAIQNEKLRNEMISQEQMHREFQLAQNIQRTFLPETLPAPAGWEINVRWRPALQVGGDFYDAFMLDEDRLGLVIADVSDKGMPAALYMTVARTLIHAEALECALPSTTLMRVNRSLLLNSHQGLFITCLYAILNIHSGEMAYTNAGHNKPVWLRPSRRDVIWLEKGGMPLGVGDGLALCDESLQLKTDDQLVFYTDGVTEAQDADGTLFGEERLFNILNRYRNAPSSSLIDSIDQKIMDYRGGAVVSDDLTLMVVRRLTESQ